MAEQRYQAVGGDRADGDRAGGRGWGRQADPACLVGKYEAGGLEGLVDGSHRPAGHPAQMLPVVEVAVLEVRVGSVDAAGTVSVSVCQSHQLRMTSSEPHTSVYLMYCPLLWE